MLGVLNYSINLINFYTSNTTIKQFMGYLDQG